MDNASSCDALATELATLLPGLFAGMTARVRCFAHIVNLASRRVMSVFDATDKQMKHTVDEICLELTELGEDLTDVSIVVEEAEEGVAGSDLTRMLKGMMEEEVEQVGQDSLQLRNTVQKVRVFHLVWSQLLKTICGEISCANSHTH